MYELSLSFALAAALMGNYILGSLHNGSKTEILFYPNTGLKKNTLVLITAICFWYFGAGCLVLMTQ